MEEEKIELVETDETTFGITAEELETIKEIKEGDEENA